MGNTVSTGKLVGAFKGTHGKPVYVLFERTHESNVYPHSPNWNAQLIGGIESVMARVFMSASACEGGSLLGGNGRTITAEGYITSWLKELANPIEMEDSIYELALGTSWTSAIPKGDFERVKAGLEAIGETRILNDLESANECALASLHTDHEALSVIYDGAHCGAWRIIPSHAVPVHGLRNEALGYKPVKAKAYRVDVPRFMKVSDCMSKHLILGEDGKWRCLNGGYAYSYLSSFICGLIKAELREPGSYRNRIKAYRDAITSALSVPADTQIIISDLPNIKEWAQRDIDRIVADSPHSKVKDGVQLSLPTDRDLLYLAASLPTEHTEWVFSTKAPSEQLCLLAS